MNKRTNERTNERTNVSCWRRHEFTPRFRVSSPTLLRTKGGDSELSLVFNNPKTYFSFWGMPLRLCWRAWRSYGHRFAFADAFGPSDATTNKEATPLGTYLIVSWSDDPDLHGVTFCRAAIVSLVPALVRICPQRGWEISKGIIGLNGFCL